jgi:hypothetical protein
MNDWLSQTSTIFVFIIMLLCLIPSCSSSTKDVAHKNQFEILVSDSFRVTLTDLASGKNDVVFSIPNDSDYIITSASLDNINKTVAVSLIENDGSPENAQIVFLESAFPYKERDIIQTSFNRIRGLSYSANGDLAFVAGGIKLDGPNSICVIRVASMNVEVVSAGRYFSGISWGYGKKKIYFSSLMDGK